MTTRIVLAAMLLAAGCSPAVPQSSTLSAATAPMTAPASRNTLPDTQKAKIRPAARSGESGLRVGEGAAIGEPIEVRRMK